MPPGEKCGLGETCVLVGLSSPLVTRPSPLQHGFSREWFGANKQAGSAAGVDFSSDSFQVFVAYILAFHQENHVTADIFRMAANAFQCT